ncbi:MAG: hypothetical protein U1F81_14595 [Verrucomicrobiaceae bacterium]
MSSRTWLSAILKGSGLLGRIGADTSSTARIDGDPQKSHRCATRFSSNTEITRQLSGISPSSAPQPSRADHQEWIAEPKRDRFPQ